MKHIALVTVLTLIAMADVHAQTCPSVSSDTTITNSCDTGFTWTGGNLNIGAPTSGSVLVTIPYEDAIYASGTLGFFNNTSNGQINAEGMGIINDGAITTLTNSGTINSEGGDGIVNYTSGTIGILNNSGSMGVVGGGFAGIGNYLATITTLNNSGAISAGDSGFGIINSGDITTLNNLETGSIRVGNDGWGIQNFSGNIGTLNNSGSISTGNFGIGINNVLSATATLNNGGEISGGFSGIVNDSSTIGTLNNYAGGTIFGELYGIVNVNSTISSTIGILNNSGTISGGFHGISNENSTISTLNNSGAILGGGGSFGIYNDNSIIGTLNNFLGATISGGDYGVGNSNSGTINILNNFGAIFGELYGIQNSSTIGTLNNSGTISAGDAGILNLSNGTITTLNNSGAILGGGGSFGIYNDNSIIGTLNNFAGATISGKDYGVGNNSGTINELNNWGVISGPGIFGITNFRRSTITILNNWGEISGGIFGITNDNLSTITTLNNWGEISTEDSGIGIINQDSVITELNNFGTISVELDGYGIYNLGDIMTLNNSRSIEVESGTGIENNTGFIGALTNSDSIQINRDGFGISNTGRINTLTNSGSIQINGDGFGIINRGNIDALINSGTISVGGSSAGISNFVEGTIAVLNNSGVITAGFGGIANGGTIAALNNSGSITAGLDGYGIYNSGTITTLNNTSTIYADVGGWGINNTETINTLNNAQGGNSSSAATTALTYSGTLPNNYNTIVNSLAHYGQLVASDARGTIAFGVMDGPSFPTGTYASVLRGISASHIDSGLSGIHNNYYYWSLVPLADDVWDMPVYFDISSNTSGLVSIENLTGSGPAILGSQSLLLTAASGTYSGMINGSGGITINGGQWILTGANTYTGGTTVASGTLSVAGASPTGFGSVSVSTGATLMGTGTINGPISVAGILKPGNSPGYLAATNTVTMNAGSTYLQDIAGTVQASSTSPVGASGYYSFLNVTNGQFVIQPGATLEPRLSNLFSVNQPGYGSANLVPDLGDRLRIVTAAGGISGRFSALTQPAELLAGTQFVPFYNMADSNSVDLAVVPTSYQTTIASASGNANAQSVGAALTQIAQASIAGSATSAQEQLLYSIAGQTTAQSISNFAQSLSGEVYAATVAVIAQTTQRTQQAVLDRLGDTAGLGLNMPMASTNMSTQVGGASSASVSSNPNVIPNAQAKAFSNGNVWGELAYQRGNRSSDNQSGGWSSNLYQLTFGSDFYSANGATLGGGFALSSTTVNPVYGSSTIQQGSLFAYGKRPVNAFVVDAMASVGLSSSNIKRGDVTGLSAGYGNNAVMGNDVMLSMGVSRPMDIESVRITPFARVTWQMVTQSGVTEGDAASALSVNRFTGNGMRGVIGVAAGSKANDPMTAKHTYRAYVGVGADSSGLLNPTLNASLAGLGTSITTPNTGSTFVQAGLYGTAQTSENTFAYAGISTEVRSGQTLGTINLGLKLQF